IFLFSLIFYSCSSAVRFTKEEESRRSESSEKTEELNEEFSETSLILESTSGTASYYADKFHGRTTANGEVYNMHKLTAAHPTYPFGTIVRITNLSNNKSIVVRINDRMPSFKGRIID